MKTQVYLAKLVCLALAVVLTGCSQQKDIEATKVAKLQSFLQKQRGPVWGIEYRVMPPDVIAISSRSVKEVSNVTQQVRPDGKISLPLMGEIFVAGMTPQQIRQEIGTAAKKYYKKVDITVYMVEYNSQQIFVFGEVCAPGPQPWTGSDTLLDVLARTQPTRLAWPEKIKVIRSTHPARGGYTPEQAAAEQCVSADEQELLNKEGAQELVIDLKAMVESGDMSHNIMLQPDDVIYVPPNPFASVGLAIQKVLFPTQQAASLVGQPAQIDNDTYLHWKYRDRYYNTGGE
jgi:polysaccharide export outer membrane protein